jgi:hypothetical protein
MNLTQYPAAVTRSSSFFLAAVALVLLFALTGPSSAQTAGKKWEAGFDVGSADISSDEDLEIDVRFDGRGGYFLNDRVELELQLLRADAVLDAELRAALGNIVIQLRPEARIAPYALVGAGVARIEDIELFSNEDETDDGTAVQAGFGARVFLGDSGMMALRLEASSLWTDTDLFGSTQNTSLTVGLSWSFGR